MTEAAHIIYEPNRSLQARIARRVTPFRAQKSLPIKLDRPVVSFTFDDCPRSALKHGVPALDAQGWRSSFYLCCGLFGQTNHFGLHMDTDDAKAVAANGHEVGNHSWHHYDASAHSLADFQADILMNEEGFANIGLPQSQTFAYPYGETYPALKSWMGTQFKGARGILPVTHNTQSDLNQIGSYPLFSGAAYERLLNQLGQLEKHPGWLTIFTHDISDTPTPWGCTPQNFLSVVEKVKQIGALVLPLAEAIDYLEARL